MKSTDIRNNSTETLIADKIKKGSFNKNVASIKNKQKSNKDVITMSCQITAKVLRVGIPSATTNLRVKSKSKHDNQEIFA